MLRPRLAILALAFALPAAGCHRSSRGPSAPSQVIRDEKEPGESIDTIGAVPDSGASSRDIGSSEGSIDIEIEESSSPKPEATTDSAESSTSTSTSTGSDEEGEDEGEGDGDGGAEPGDLDIDE